MNYLDWPRDLPGYPEVGINPAVSPAERRHLKALLDGGRGYGVTKMQRVVKPYGVSRDGRRHVMDLPLATPARNGETRRDAQAREQRGRTAPAPAIPICRRCKAPTLHIDEFWEPICDWHGVATKSTVPPGINIGNFALYVQIQQIVDDALATPCHFCGGPATGNDGVVPVCDAHAS